MVKGEADRSGDRRWFTGKVAVVSPYLGYLSEREGVRNIAACQVLNNQRCSLIMCACTTAEAILIQSFSQLTVISGCEDGLIVPYTEEGI